MPYCQQRDIRHRRGSLSPAQSLSRKEKIPSKALQRGPCPRPQQKENIPQTPQQQGRRLSELIARGATWRPCGTGSWRQLPPPPARARHAASRSRRRPPPSRAAARSAHSHPSMSVSTAATDDQWEPWAPRMTLCLAEMLHPGQQCGLALARMTQQNPTRSEPQPGCGFASCSSPCHSQSTDQHSKACERTRRRRSRQPAELLWTRALSCGRDSACGEPGGGGRPARLVAQAVRSSRKYSASSAARLLCGASTPCSHDVPGFESIVYCTHASSAAGLLCGASTPCSDRLYWQPIKRFGR